MNAGTLTRESDIEDLVAWMDDELGDERAAQVAELVRTDPAWQTAHEQFHAVDTALDAWTVPAPSAGLSERIVRSAHRNAFWRRTLQVAGPLAAAAAIVLAVFVGVRPTQPAGPGPSGSPIEAAIAKTLQGVPAEDQLLVQNLPFFQNYQEVVSYQDVSDVVDAETLSALSAIDADGGL